MKKITTVTASNGIPFTVRLVLPGDTMGHEMCRTNEDTKPIIEFYDARFPHCYDFVGTKEDAIAAGAPVLGQKVSSYFLETIAVHANYRVGLDLHGGVHAWKIDGVSLHRALSDLGVSDKTRIVVVYDSQDPDAPPQVWAPPTLSIEVVHLNRSEELGGREPNTDAAEIALLEAGSHHGYTNYQRVD